MQTSWVACVSVPTALCARSASTLPAEELNLTACSGQVLPQKPLSSVSRSCDHSLLYRNSSGTHHNEHDPCMLMRHSHVPGPSVCSICIAIPLADLCFALMNFDRVIATLLCNTAVNTCRFLKNSIFYVLNEFYINKTFN